MVFLITQIGIVGEISDSGEDFYVWTHKKFDIGYNGKQIVDVNLTSEAKKKLSPGAKISFSYEVRYCRTFIQNISYRYKIFSPVGNQYLVYFL